MLSADSAATAPVEGVGGVLVIGEALIDIVAHTDDAPAVEHVGGSPANVALALGRLGDPVRLLTALGTDARGHRIERHLTDSGVVVDPRSWVLDHTSTARATIQPDGSARYDFDINWILESATDPLTEDVLHVGSVGTFLSPGADQVLRMVEHAATGTIVSFDPNIRSALIGDRSGAIARVESITELSDLVKLSDEDAAWLYPEWDVGAVADHFLESGARIIAITMGGNGVLLASPHARTHVPAPATTVHDTVGAGDTFSAGLIDAILHERSLLDESDERALLAVGRQAAAAAAITVQRPGADPPTRAELNRAIREAELGSRAWGSVARDISGQE